VKELRAQAFVLEDGAGNVRARLGVNAGAAALKLYDQRGRVRLEAGVRDDDDTPGVTLFDPQGRFRVAVCIHEGAPTIVLLDAKGGTLAKLP